MPVFDGTMPLFVHANTVAQIEAALAWAKEAQLKIVLVGGQDAWRMASQLKETDTAVIITLSTALRGITRRRKIGKQRACAPELFRRDQQCQ